MEALDRLDWRSGVSFTSFGRAVGIRLTDPAVHQDVVRVLPPGWRPRTDPVVERLYSVVVGDLEPRGRIQRVHLVYAGVTRAVRTTNWPDALHVLESDLKLFVAEYARN